MFTGCIAEKTATPTAPSFDAELTQKLHNIITAPKYNHSTGGILFEDLETGEVIYELNADKLFIPASVIKLYSTAVALDTLGADYRFRTPIYRTGEVDESGKLYADLVLVASGDLTMGGRDSDGHIEVSPIMINDNLIDIVITPTNEGELATVEWRPHTVLYNVSTSVETVAAGSPAHIEITSETGTINVEGKIPVGNDPLVRVCRVENPATFARPLLIEALEREGVEVTTSASDFEHYYNSLPIMGVDGSLAMIENEVVQGKVRAKTGTTLTEDALSFRLLLLSKVLAGYMNTSSGRQVVFSMFVNDVHIDQMDDLFSIMNDQAKICELVYVYY
jgi:D-alanyl-D-alanine carboxypeptidase